MASKALKETTNFKVAAYKPKKTSTGKRRAKQTNHKGENENVETDIGNEVGKNKNYGDYHRLKNMNCAVIMAAYLTKGSRMLTLFQTLEKLNGQKCVSKLQQEDLQQLRYSTSKIQQYVATQEKVHRDLILKNSTYLELILTTFETCSDTTTQQNVIGILNELIGKSNTGKKASTLVAHGATHTLFQVLVYESREPTCSEELLISIHQVLAKLGPKDRKFGIKARLSQALGVTLHLLKSLCSNLKAIQPIVTVIKLYSSNAVNASFLGKNGAVSCLFKILSACGRKHLTLVKYALDSLALLVRSKSNSARAVGQGGVPVLLTMFYDWHRVDSKNRHINIRKAILTVLKNVTNLKSGRKALMDSDGIRILYTTCQESIECRELEALIFAASLIMRKCFPKNRIPLTTLRSAVTCPVPESDFHVIDRGEGHDKSSCSPCSSATSPVHSIKPKKPDGDNVHCFPRITTSGDDNGYESSLDHDDDLSSDDDNDRNRGDSDDDVDRNLGQVPYTRSWEDLMTYKRFFRELYEFDGMCHNEDPNTIDPHVPQSDVSYNPRNTSINNSNTRSTQSANYVNSSSINNYNTNKQNQSSRGAPRFSVPNLSNRDDVDKALKDLGISPRKGNRDTDLSSEGTSNSTSSLRTASRNFLYESPSEAYFSQTSPSTSAVNVKTGSSVFSLDFSSDSSKSPKTSKVSKMTRNKQTTLKLTKGGSGGGLEKVGKRNSLTNVKVSKSEEDWFSEPIVQTNDPAFCVTPLLTSRTDRMRYDLNSDDEDSIGTEEDFVTKIHETELYLEIASKTRSVGRFNKVAYPDLNGHVAPIFKEPLYEKVFGMQRKKIFEDIDRFINPDQTIDQSVYDLDAIAASAGVMYNHNYSTHINRDEIKISRKDELTDQLRFNSQFESGNLRKAIQIRKYEYDLILSPDVNTNHHHQWFYFEVSNMEAGVKYRFNLVNCEKLNSQFNFGMKPVMFSVTEAVQGRPMWVRTGGEICYYKNHYVRSAQTTGGAKGKSYYTGTFTVKFKHENDVCYLAYHYPYTYSMLQYHIYKWEEKVDKNAIYLRNQVLTTTLGGNPVPVLTITSYPSTMDSEGIDQLRSRPYIFLSGRVHPGESNASWVMKGTIDFLLGDSEKAKSLRDQYIFKIVPMLNPDGVINGCHRCSIVAEDLNRRWALPCPKLHPPIYHCKGLLQFLNAMQKSPLVYCDYHGHSRRKNVFLYGCSPGLSWMNEDTDNPAVLGNRMEDTSYKTLPRVLQTLAPAFSLQNCSFMVEKPKEATARVVVWRQCRVVKSYTMESSYCGCDQGPYKGMHISTRELEEMGAKFCEGLLKVKGRHIKMIKNGASSTTSAVDSLSELSGSNNIGLEGAMAASTLEPLRLLANSDEGSDSDNDDDEEDDDEDDDN